ncbi:MAG: hypothetical protein EON98_05090 [Chitinophagaceae bacterium]|nr:MAG: hypothetical protein EON98_05090 [Chitinophagaceae bacterium]
MRLIIIPFLCFALAACLQQKAVIKKANAFYYVRTPGIVQVDDRGNELPQLKDTVFEVYLESSIPLTVTRGWKNDKVYAVSAEPIKEATISPEVHSDNENEQQLKPSKGNFFYRLSLRNGEPSPAPQKLKSAEILLEIRAEGKPFYYRLKQVKPIQSPQFG